MPRLTALPLALLAAAACWYASRHWPGTLAVLYDLGAAWAMAGAGWLLWLAAECVRTGGSPPDAASHATSPGSWNAAATPADKAAMTAEIDALSADTLTLMMSERGAIFALDESDAGQDQEAGQ